MLFLSMTNVYHKSLIFALKPFDDLIAPSQIYITPNYLNTDLALSVLIFGLVP